jgi:hypothetical protein
LYPIEENDTGVIMTTIKLKAQFALVDNALAGAQIRKGTTSAGYNQVMPSQPTAKKVLKIKRKAAATIPGTVPPTLVITASMTMEADCPAAPNSMSLRRPIFSTIKTAIQEARKYSVPLHAARIRDMKGLRLISFC